MNIGDRVKTIYGGSVVHVRALTTNPDAETDDAKELAIVQYDDGECREFKRTELEPA